MDIYDRAQQLEQAEREHLLEQRRRRQINNQAQPSPDVCDCGAQIPAARRKALPGVQTCVDCAQRAEVMARGFFRP